MKTFENGFNGNNASIARQIIEKHLANACVEMGVKSIKLGNITYTNSELRAKVAAVSPSVEVVQNVVFNFEDFKGKTFKFPGKSSRYTVERMKEGKVVAYTQRGKGYLFQPHQLQGMIKV